MSEKSVRLAYQIRRHALEMTNRGGTSHIGSIFSTADFVAVLYADVLRYDPANPPDAERARVSSALMDAVTAMAVALPEHTVVPYPNIPKSEYPKNIPLKVYSK